MQTRIVSKFEEGLTIEKYARKVLVNCPLSLIYKYFRTNCIKINNKKTKLKDRIKENDTIYFYVNDEQYNSFISNEPSKKGSDSIKKYIYYEDENIIVINKPRKMLVQSKDNKEKSLTELMQEYTYYCMKTSNVNFFFSPAHRLDRNTSGLVVFGKSVKVMQKLGEIFKDHEQIEKHYLTLVEGNLYGEGKIDIPLHKDIKTNMVRETPINQGGKSAITLYKVLNNFNNYTFLDVQILTGRTHQIRAHMKAIGHPIIGDPKYGNFQLNKYFEKTYDLKSQLLHSYQIIFKIKDGELSYLNKIKFSCPLDEKFKEIISQINTKGE